MRPVSSTARPTYFCASCDCEHYHSEYTFKKLRKTSSTMAARVALDLSFKSPIRQLTDENYQSWLVDIRALLRKQKIWKYTQESPPETLTVAALAKWKESSQEAADTMTPTISDPVKQRLATADFDCGLLMWTQLATRFRPTGDGEFMRLTKELYTLKYTDFVSMTEYLTIVKTLQERIAATDVVLTPDKQTILALSMTLPEHLQYLTKIWALTPDMTTTKATNMLLEEERKGEKPQQGEAFGAAAVGNRAGKPTCKTCGRVHGPVCWSERPDLAPEWYQERGTKRKRGDDGHSTALVAVGGIARCF